MNRDEGLYNLINIIIHIWQVQEAKLKAEEEAEERRHSKDSEDDNDKPFDTGSQDELDKASTPASLDAQMIGISNGPPEIEIENADTKGNV